MLFKFLDACHRTMPLKQKRWDAYVNARTYLGNTRGVRLQPF